MRLQGGPLHVGWRCREHLVYVCVQPSGGAVDVPTVAAKPLAALSGGRGHYFTPTVAVTSFMGRSPLYGGGRLFEAVTCLRWAATASSRASTVPTR